MVHTHACTHKHTYTHTHIIMTQLLHLFYSIYTALSVTLDSSQLQGPEGSFVTVCATINNATSLEIPVLAALIISRADQPGKYPSHRIISFS